MRKFLLSSGLVLTLVLAGCSETQQVKSQHAKQVAQQKATNQSVKAQLDFKSTVLNQDVTYRSFSLRYRNTDDLPKISDTLSQQVDEYLHSIKNRKAYHVQITSVSTFGVYNEFRYAVSDTHHMLTVTVYLIHK